MSAILSADDLNDFISPSVACIKPVETLPDSKPQSDPENPYEVTTEDVAQAANAPPAQISLTDCLACSGCVTSAEAVLVSLQSYQEVLSTLDAFPEIPIPGAGHTTCAADWKEAAGKDGKIFVASVSPQARASIAATFGVSERAAGNMISRLLSGEEGLRSGGQNGSGFAWVLDTNVFRDITLVAAADEVDAVTSSKKDLGDFTQRTSRPKKPILTSACPGWICYAEKTHPHVLPHISKLKSPQALAGTLVKSVLSRKFGIPPDKIWHMAVMPCFDKKLEASREELTDAYWSPSDPNSANGTNGLTNTSKTRGVRDVDLVITSRELLSLASARSIPFATLSLRPLPRTTFPPFPDPTLHRLLFPPKRRANGAKEAGSSGGYLQHICRTVQVRHPGSRLSVHRGRNADVVEYAVVLPADDRGVGGEKTVFRAARYYGFRNIQNLVRRLKPKRESRLPGAAARGSARKVGAGAGRGGVTAVAKAEVEEYDYVEVMACPGGCTNGGGQVKVVDLEGLGVANEGSWGQKEWLGRVDEAYFSMEESEDEEDDEGGDQDGEADVEMADGEGSDDGVIDGVDTKRVRGFVNHWVDCTGIELDRLVCTTYRKVESDVGKSGNDVERVAGLASTIGGGW